MQQKVISIFILLLAFLPMAAQQRYSNQWVAGMSGGYLPTDGYNGSVFLERYIRDSFSSLKFEGLYMNQKVATDVSGYDIDCATYGGTFSYNYSLEKFVPSPFYVNLSVGGIGGYQKIRYDDSMMEVDANDKFVYGFIAGIQLELIAYKSLSLFIEPKAYYLINSDIRKMNGSIGAGMKIYL